MEKMTIGRAEQLTSPNPFAIITVKKPDGKTNAMACSWWCYASNHPATIVCCLSKRGFTGSCIQKTGAFGLNIVSEKVKDAAYACGTCSGREMDKAAEVGLPLVEAEGYAQEMVDASRLWMSCRLVNQIDIGDHMMYVGEVDTIDGDESVPGMYAWGGYASLGKAEQ